MVDDKHQIAVLGAESDEEQRVVRDQVGPKSIGDVASHNHCQDWDNEQREMAASEAGPSRGFGFG
jgi:hypothetical protein